MKKIFLLVLVIGFFSTFSYASSDVEIVGAKAQLLYVYKALESNALRISVIFEKEASEMQEVERAGFHIIRGDLEAGMYIVSGVLGLYTLQGVQVSTPSEAVILIRNASLDGIDSLNLIQERLRERLALLTNISAINTVKQSISDIDTAIEAIKALEEELNKLGH